MIRYRLSSRADRDLEDIWRFSAQRWDVAQADAYVASIISTIAHLNASEMEEVPSTHRRQLVGSHAIFYRFLPTKIILVVRILHQSMDPGRHMDR